MLWGWPFPVWESIVKFSLWTAASAGVLAAIAAFAAGYIGYELSDAIQRASDERVAALTTQAAQLQKDTSEANARAAEAQLALEKYKAPRVLSKEQKSRLISEMEQFSGQRFSGLVAASVSDASSSWASIVSALQSAHWVLVPPVGDSEGDPPAGVTIFPRAGVTIAIPFGEETLEMPVASRLVALLNEFGIAASAVRDDGPQKMAETIKIEIGPKP